MEISSALEEYFNKSDTSSKSYGLIGSEYSISRFKFSFLLIRIIKYMIFNFSDKELFIRLNFFSI